MTIDQLIGMLEDYRDDIGGDAEVRLMMQESWPFENHIYGLASSVEIAEAESDSESDEDGDEGGEDAKPEPILYVVEGGQIGYGTKRAWEVVRGC
jgi:hypothetical protein